MQIILKCLCRQIQASVFLTFVVETMGNISTIYIDIGREPNDKVTLNLAFSTSSTPVNGT